MIATQPELCLKCGACVPICPTESLLLLKTGITLLDENCTGCLDCVRFCPLKALKSINV